MRTTLAACLLASLALALPNCARAEAVTGGTAVPNAHAAADPVQPPSPLKTLTFLSLASINDFAFGYMFGGLVGGSGMILANLTTGWGLYHVHEVAWGESGHYVSLPDDTTGMRTTTFTVVNSARIFGLGLLLTGNAAISAGFVVFNALGDAVAYVVTDRIWLPDDGAAAAP
jgi:uncharacterized membrane protein